MARVHRILAVLLLLVSLPVCAQDAPPARPLAPPKPTFPVALTSQDPGALREICQLAQRSEHLTLEQATSVGTYCVELLARLGNALGAREGSGPPPPKETKDGQ